MSGGSSQRRYQSLVATQCTVGKKWFAIVDFLRAPISANIEFVIVSGKSDVCCGSLYSVSSPSLIFIPTSYESIFNKNTVNLRLDGLIEEKVVS